MELIETKCDYRGQKSFEIFQWNNDYRYIREYWKNGALHSEKWISDTHILHRVEGPCAIWYDFNGKLENKAYYLNGQHIKEKDWKKHPLVTKYLFEQELEKRWLT